MNIALCMPETALNGGVNTWAIALKNICAELDILVSIEHSLEALSSYDRIIFYHPLMFNDEEVRKVTREISSYYWRHTTNSAEDTVLDPNVKYISGCDRILPSLARNGIPSEQIVSLPLPLWQQIEEPIRKGKYITWIKSVLGNITLLWKPDYIEPILQGLLQAREETGLELKFINVSPSIHDQIREICPTAVIADPESDFDFLEYQNAACFIAGGYSLMECLATDIPCFASSMSGWGGLLTEENLGSALKNGHGNPSQLSYELQASRLFPPQDIARDICAGVNYQPTPSYYKACSDYRESFVPRFRRAMEM